MSHSNQNRSRRLASASVHKLSVSAHPPPVHFVLVRSRLLLGVADTLPYPTLLYPTPRGHYMGWGPPGAYPTPTSATHPQAPMSPPPHPVCPFRACSHTREQRLQHQEWDPHRYPAMEPTMIAGGCGSEVCTAPAETMTVCAMPTCTTGRGGVIEPHAHGNVVRQVADNRDNTWRV